MTVIEARHLRAGHRLTGHYIGSDRHLDVIQAIDGLFVDDDGDSGRAIRVVTEWQLVHGFSYLTVQPDYLMDVLNEPQTITAKPEVDLLAEDIWRMMRNRDREGLIEAYFPTSAGVLTVNICDPLDQHLSYPVGAETVKMKLALRGQHVHNVDDMRTVVRMVMKGMRRSRVTGRI